MIKYDLVQSSSSFIGFEIVKTRIEADDPLFARRNDSRLPYVQYEDGEEHIYYDCTSFDTDYIVEAKDDLHVLYTRDAYEFCVLGVGRLVDLDREKPVRNVVHANLWEKMRAEADERFTAMAAGIDYDHLSGMPWIGTIEE